MADRRSICGPPADRLGTSGARMWLRRAQVWTAVPTATAGPAWRPDGGIGAGIVVSLAWSAAVASAMGTDAAGTSPSRSVTPQRGPGGGGRRRRPSGEPPPLPRNLGVSGRVWVAMAAILVAIIGLVLASQALASGFDRWNAAVLRGIVGIRTGWLTSLMVGVNTVLASRWTVGVLRLGTLAALV